MSRLSIILLLLVALPAWGATTPPGNQCLTVEKDGVFQFKAAAVVNANPVWNFTGSCETPPPPPVGPVYSDVQYPNTGNSILRHADITQFAQVFGRTKAADAPTPFPGDGGSCPVILSFPGDKTLAIPLAVPTARQSGWVQVATYFGQVMDIGYTQNPAVWPTSPAYVRNGIRIGQQGPHWTTYASTQAGLLGSPWYLVMRLHTPKAGTVKAGFCSYFANN